MKQTKRAEIKGAREAALFTLMQVLEAKGKDRRTLSSAAPFYRFDDRRKENLYEILVKGTLERLYYLDYVLDGISRTKTSAMKPVIRNILRIALYQILYLDSVPERAAVNEAVVLTKKHGLSGLSSFVNGVLRTAVRKKEEFSLPEREKFGDLPYLSLKYSVPQWICERFAASYGVDALERILSGLEGKPGVSIRVNTSLADPAAVEEKLKAAGVCIRKNRYLPYAFSLSGIENLTDLPGFREGEYVVQDQAAMLAGEAAGDVTGKKCLDVCAAPGGKSMHLADKGAYVLSCDKTKDKVALIDENRKKCGFSRIETAVADALIPDPEKEGTYDLVLADLPCSGLGTMGHKADLRYRVTEEDIRSLAALQRQMLSVCAGYVKSGGLLLYSTCTISPEENEENTDRFLKEFPEFTTVDLKERLPEGLVAGLQEAPGGPGQLKRGRLQILPGYFPGDGAYLALMKKQ